MNRGGEDAVGTPRVKLNTLDASRRKPADGSTPARKAPSWSELRPAPSRVKLAAAFAAVYVLWGSTFLAIRFAVATLPPFLMAGTRHLIAGVVLYPLASLRSRERPTRANWTAAALMGALLLFGGNGGVSWAEQIVPSGVAALLVATVSLWMVIIEWLRPGGTRPGGRVIVGLVLGFAGLTFLMGPSKLAGGGRVDPLGATVLVLAALSWATGSVFSRRLPLPRMPLLGTAMQSLAGGVLLILVGLLTGQGGALDWKAVSLRSVLALGYLIVFGSLLGFSAYTWLLAHAPPTRVATYAYVNPVVAMFLGWALAGEQPTLRTLLAAAVIVGGVVLVITARQHATAPAAGRELLPGEARREAAETAHKIGAAKAPATPSN
jgi:drug/metabolite transporter (DMT)-like permease